MTQLREDVVSRAVTCKLLSQQQVEQCRAGLSAEAGAEAVLAALVKAGGLTRWQVKQLQAPKPGSFFISHYKLLEPIGAGAMGQVFRAADQNVARRQVAVKILPKAAATPAAVARFRREGAAALSLQHEHIVRCFELGQHGETHFLVMELVEGATLKDYIGKHGQLSVQETARIGREVALALEHAWQQQIIHRDIKPSNILLTRDNRVKLADLGLARFFGPQEDGQSLATRTGMLMGTLDYLAPEQAEDAKRADIRSDIYSLGCTLYHCLTGEPPFAAGTEVQKIVAHRERPVTPIGERNPKVENLFADIIEKQMLAKRPEDRYQTPPEVAVALEAWTGGVSRSFNVLDLLEEVVQQDATTGTRLAVETQHGWDTHREYDRQGETGPLATRPAGFRGRVERVGRAVGLSSFRDTLIAASAVAIVAVLLVVLFRSQRSEETVAANSPEVTPMPARTVNENEIVPASSPASATASEHVIVLTTKTEPPPASTPQSNPQPPPQTPSSTSVGSSVRFGGVDWTVMRTSGEHDDQHSASPADGRSTPTDRWSASRRRPAGSSRPGGMAISC